MKFVSDPKISLKIDKMKQRVKWQNPLILKRDIDQTSLVIEDGNSENPEFSFLVIGDSGTGYHRGHSPQRQIAELLLENREQSRFILHTGDVVYLVGASEYYPANFIQPYREFLVGGEVARNIRYDQMIFNLPFLPVLGNHDYYDLPLVFGVLAQLTSPVRQVLRSKIDLDVGWQGSRQGEAYAQAFIDCLERLNPQDLEQHLAQHYTAKTETGYCLRYQPGKFTRIPNRYYTFRYGGIDFFALDSNTFNAPEPLPKTPEGEQQRRQLLQQLEELERQKMQILGDSANLNPNDPVEAEQLDDLQAKLEQIEEVKLDIEKKLNANSRKVVDYEQLNWFKQKLIESWQNPNVRGRVVYFHHPPYVTEATKWYQSQTLAVRHQIRQVLNGVAAHLKERPEGRPIVDLVLNGHAHCLEHLYTGETGHADSNIHWIICGGSGYSLRRQRQEGPKLMEPIAGENGSQTRPVAESLLFLGRTGQGRKKRRPYSALRIDVLPGQPPQFRVQPLVAERFDGEWHQPIHEAFTI